MDKYTTCLQQYNCDLSDCIIAEEVKQTIADHSAQYNNIETYKKLFSMIDLTTLNAARMASLCEKSKPSV